MAIPGTKQFSQVDGPRKEVLWSRTCSRLGEHHPSKGLVQQIQRPTEVYCCCCMLLYVAAATAAAASSCSAEVENICRVKGA